MNRELRGYISRFTILHVLTYWVVGSIFYHLAGYQEALETMEYFELWRPLENIGAVVAVFLGQLIRGLIMALLLYPFYNTFMKKKNGWLLLFLLIYGLTALGGTLFIPNMLQEMIGGISISEFIQSVIIGIPEITVQMLLFSWLLFKWEKRKSKKVAVKNI